MGEAIRRLEYAGPNKLNRKAKSKKMQVVVERKVKKQHKIVALNVREVVLNFIKIFAFAGSVVGTIGLIIMLLVGYNNLSSINNEIYNINSDIKELQAERDYLTLMLEPYKEPERIEKLAEERLNMSKPESDQVAEVTIIDNFDIIMTNENPSSKENVADNDGAEEQKMAIGKIFNEIFH